MERHHRDLEPETDKDKEQRHHQQRSAAGHLNRRRDLVEVRGPGHAVQVAHPEQQERRRDCAEHEIFHGGFLRLEGALVERGEDVEAQAGQFQRDKDRDQFLGAD